MSQLDYINFEFTYVDNNNKLYGQNIEYIYTDEPGGSSFNCVYSVAEANGTGYFNCIYNTIASSGTGYFNCVYNAASLSNTGYFNCVYNAEYAYNSGYFNCVYGAASSSPTGTGGGSSSTGTFILHTYKPFAPRRIPFIARICVSGYPYPTGSVEC